MKHYKVAIVHDFLVKNGGAERVVKVLADMFPNAPIYTLFYDEGKMANIFPRDRVKTPRFSNFPLWIRRKYRLFLPFLQDAITDFDLNEYDIIISSSGAFSLGLITKPNAIHICYCHSPARYLWDYKNQYLKENNIGYLLKPIISKIFLNMRIKDKEASLRPDFFIANSKNVQQRIRKFYRRESDIIFPPVGIERFEISENNEDYFLIVSRLSPYKKIDQAIHLFNKLKRKLIIIGDGIHKNYLQEIAGPTVEVLGRKSDDVIVEYMKNMRALIFPGEDDFGITPVEAMACGKPVLAYGKGGALETVIPGETGEFFYEHSLESMEDGLGRLLFNEYKYDSEKTREHAETFSNEKFEEQLYNYLDEKLEEYNFA